MNEWNDRLRVRIDLERVRRRLQENASLPVDASGATAYLVHFGFSHGGDNWWSAQARHLLMLFDGEVIARER